MPDSRDVTAEGYAPPRFSARQVVIAWTLYGCVTAVQEDIAAALRGIPIPFWQGFGLQLPQAWIWAALTPVILRLGARFPLRGPGWPWRLLLHVAVSSVFVLMIHLVYEAYLPLLWPQSAPLLKRTLSVYVLWVTADSMLYWVVLAIGHVKQEAARVAAKARREAVLEEHLARARLDALTLRLQPHFLFNTLHAISALVLERPKDANRMIARLSDLLRLTLSRTRTPFVPLRQELELLEHYIALQELRFGDHLSVNLVVSSDVSGGTVPALLLQPIVENAVRHAIGEGEQAARVDIVVGRVGNSLRLEVSDNGPGFRGGEGTLEEGEGLRNTRARLQEAYGDRQRLVLANGAAGGASVTIELPIEPAAPDGPDKAG